MVLTNLGTRTKRAMGGPCNSRQTYLVGESGPELFIPNIDGTIINNMKQKKSTK